MDEFTEADANEWVNEVPNQEIREYWCRNLLQQLTYSDELVQKWTSDSNQSVRLTGFWLYTRLMLIKSDVLDRINIQPVIEKALIDVHSEDALLHIAALNVLKQVVRRDKEGADSIMKHISDFATSDNRMEKEIYDNLQFEFKIRS